MPPARRQCVPREPRGAQATVEGEEEMKGTGPGEITELTVQDLADCWLLGKSQFLMEQLTISMASLHSYVKLPELVGGIPTPLRNIKVKWDYYPQDMEQ